MAIDPWRWISNASTTLSNEHAPALEVWSAAVEAAFTVGLFVLAWFAWGAARGTLLAAKEANEQTRHDSAAQTRPYVSVEILPSLFGPGDFDIRITNSGRSPARRMTLQYDTWPEPLDDIAESLRALFDRPRTLPPGCAIRAVWRLETSPGESFSDGTTEAGMSKVPGQITVRYWGDDRAESLFTDDYSVMPYDAGFWPVPEAGPMLDEKTTTREMGQFYLLGQAIARHIGEARR